MSRQMKNGTASPTPNPADVAISQTILVEVKTLGLYTQVNKSRRGED